MFIPAGLDYVQGQPDFAFSFAASAGVTIFWGMLFVLAFRGMYSKPTTAQMYLATTLSWILVCSFAAVPFVFAPFSISYTDAFFEAMSGLSTMGATIYPDLDNCSDGIILWRSLLHWFGGLGIIALAMLLSPFLRIGGIKLFRFNVLTMTMVQSLRQKLMPHAVLVPKFNCRPVTTDIILSVLIFMITFCITAVISVLLLSMCGLDFLTSVSAVFSALGNTGIGLGPVIGSSGPGFCSLPSFAKWVLSADMLLGRLEFMSIFILILPMAWKRNILGRCKSEAAF